MCVFHWAAIQPHKTHYISLRKKNKKKQRICTQTSQPGPANSVLQNGILSLREAEAGPRCLHNSQKGPLLMLIFHYTFEPRQPTTIGNQDQYLRSGCSSTYVSIAQKQHRKHRRKCF